jgi:hypothetical protein
LYHETLYAQEIANAFYTELQELQGKIEEEELKDSVVDIYGHYLATEGAAPAYSSFVLKPSTNGPRLEGAEVVESVPQHILGEDVLGQDLQYAASLKYVHAPGTRVREGWHNPIKII